jgi:hypothetical protein
MSRIDMNIPNTMIRNAINRRGEIRSTAGAAVLIVLRVGVALDMIGSGQDVLC